MSKARELSQRAGVDGALSNRNLIINGAMQVAQRGTSVTAGASNTYTLDRWIAREGVVSQSTDVPAGKGFKNSLFYDNGGVRSSLNFRQVIEDGFTSLDGQDVTISFWIKTSVTADVWVDLHDTHTSSTFNCPANTWVHHTYTASNVDTSVFTNYWGGPHAHVDFNFGSSYPDVYITGVQLEVGDTATPFEHRSFGQELALCQRYYYTTSWALSGVRFLHGFTSLSTTDTRGSYYLPVSLRASPTVSYVNLEIREANISKPISALGSGTTNGNPNEVVLVATCSGLTAGNAGSFRSTGAGNIQFDAEL